MRVRERTKLAPWTTSISLLAVAGLLACSDRTPITAPLQEVSKEQLLQALTPEAAANLTSDGHLQLAPPAETGRPQISGALAGRLAVAAAKFNFPTNYQYFESQRGGRIDFQRLQPCGDPLYVTSPFDRLENDDLSTSAHPWQKMVGPFWFVRLCGPAADPQMNVVVSAYSDLSVRADGHIEFPAIGGADMLSEGIPLGRSANELPSPEAAVVLAAAATGRRVNAAPLLVLPFNLLDGSALIARWELTLDAPIRAIVNGAQVQASKVYVSAVRDYQKPPSQRWVAAMEQPASVQIPWEPLPVVGESQSHYEARRAADSKMLAVKRLPQFPVVFTPLSLTR